MPTATKTLFISVLFTLLFSLQSYPQARIQLHRDWQLQSSCKVKDGGESISRSGFSTVGWHHAEVPTTVVAALVADKTYPDPYYGMNLRSFPGMDYSSKEFFANQPMPADSPFRCSWWFRTEFFVPKMNKGEHFALHLDGINYRGSVWMNGKKIADKDDMAGTFRIFEFDVTAAAHAGKNALAVEVTAPTERDLAITWVDWNPTPADKDMGLWKDVYITSSKAVTLRHPFIHSQLSDNYTKAALTISADLHNLSGNPVVGILRAKIRSVQLQQRVQLAGGEEKTVTFSSEKFPQLHLSHPQLWWPYQMGKPNLYQARLDFETGGFISDSAQVEFGIREIKSELTPQNVRLFEINGRKVLIRGGGWSSDMLLRSSEKRMEAELEYVRDMGLNTVRLEGKLERDEFYTMADRMGILLMPGWCCCDMWEHWKDWDKQTTTIAGDSLRNQIDRLRNHPSILAWLYGSDNPPPPEVESMYLAILHDEQWPNPSISSASQTPTSVTGASGVKMTGPYDYEPPDYWLLDKQAGGAYGFNTETSPGPAIPPLESLERFIPKQHLWPRDEYWSFHAGGERFTNINIFTNALDQRYGSPADLNDFLRKSQAMAYEGERAMFEAYARNKYNSTGVIQWMLNNGWPSIIWHLYDYYLIPAGGYFGTKKACEQLHVQYSYDDNSVAVINGLPEPQPAMHVSAKFYSLDARLIASKDAEINVPADSSTRALELPTAQLPTTYFLQLQLHDKSGKLVSENFYWLSSKPDTLDWARRDDTVYTPQSQFGDLTALNSLPQVKLQVQPQWRMRSGNERLTVTLRNPTKTVAFMTALRVSNGEGDNDVVPIFWSDNYISLLPGESREITASFDPGEGATPVLHVAGWNIAQASFPIAASKGKSNP